ncbi:MAG: FtsW/RodA/SpoVE family cell cycle protein [Alphaproteobacteria bacterium]|nr:FtsW/RodA/SpoVE family cell cycle protein [Alphaproteobacteria bacterium]
MSPILMMQRWWRSIDRLTFFSTLFLFILGALLSFTYSSSLATKLNISDPLLLTKRHIIHCTLALLVMIVCSGIPDTLLLRLNQIGWFIGFALILLTFVKGTAFKGAQRWLSFGFFSFQPAEIIRATFPVFTAWILTQTYQGERNKIIFSFIPTLLASSCLLMQPDIGMAFLICVTYFAQLIFIMRRLTSVVIAFLLPTIIIGTTLMFSAHSRARIKGFLEGGSSEKYQVTQSIRSLQTGGMLGVGPGDGTIKQHLPDMHSDFILGVIGEELGVLFCIFVFVIYFFIASRALIAGLSTQNLYIMFISVGCAIYIVSQAFVNASSALGLIPPKGTTLPFISYGGTSLIAAGWVMGALLNVSRRHVQSRESL